MIFRRCPRSYSKCWIGTQIPCCTACSGWSPPIANTNISPQHRPLKSCIKIPIESSTDPAEYICFLALHLLHFPPLDPPSDISTLRRGGHCLRTFRTQCCPPHNVVTLTTSPFTFSAMSVSAKRLLSLQASDCNRPNDFTFTLLFTRKTKGWSLWTVQQKTSMSSLSHEFSFSTSLGLFFPTTSSSWFEGRSKELYNATCLYLPSAGSDRRCDNVLSDHGYVAPQGAVIHEYGAMVGW
jgi:hypothetical protein